MKIFATFFLALLAVACTFFHRTKNEDFTRATIQLGDGDVHIFTRGTYSFSAFTLTTEYADPYLFVVAYETKKRFDQPLEFQILELRTGSGQILADNWTASEELSTTKDSLGLYRAAFSASNLRIERTPLKISGIVRVNGKLHQFGTTLYPKTTVEWRNIWADMLGSV